MALATDRPPLEFPNRAYVAVGRDNASGSAANVTQVSTTITATSGSASATVASATGLFVGMFVSQPKYPNGTVINAISGTTLTLSNVASANLTTAAVRFSPLLDAQTMGATGGELGHVSTVGETASHTHTATSVVTDPGHAHTYTAPQSPAAITGAALSLLFLGLEGRQQAPTLPASRSQPPIQAQEADWRTIISRNRSS